MFDGGQIVPGLVIENDPLPVTGCRGFRIGCKDDGRCCRTPGHERAQVVAAITDPCTHGQACARGKPDSHSRFDGQSCRADAVALADKDIFGDDIGTAGKRPCCIFRDMAADMGFCRRNRWEKE